MSTVWRREWPMYISLEKLRQSQLKPCLCVLNARLTMLLRILSFMFTEIVYK